MKDKIVEAIKTCYDPEIPVNIYELGLIYDINVDESNNVSVNMTLTSPACPVAGTLPGEVEQKIRGLPEVNNAKVEVVWEPQWSPVIASRGAGVAEGDRLTIIIEVTIKNGLLALLLITSMFPHDALKSQDAETVAVIEAARDGCTYTVLLFGAVSLILGTISVIHRRSIIGSAG